MRLATLPRVCAPEVHAMQSAIPAIWATWDWVGLWDLGDGQAPLAQRNCPCGSTWSRVATVEEIAAHTVPLAVKR